MTGTVILSPLLPWPLLAGFAAIALAGIALAVWRGLAGWALRGLAALVVIAALTGPSWRQEDRAPLTDIVLLVEDRTASQRLSDRAEQTEQAAETLAARIAARPNTELRRVTVTDGEGDTGTQLMTALSDALAEEPRARVAGMILLSDGRLHDLDQAPDLPAPLHLLLTGQPEDWDRRLIVQNAPAFAILDEEVTLTLRIEDSGDVPETEAGGQVPLDISIDGAEPQRFMVATGRDLELPLTLPHGGRNVIQFTTPEAEGELTARNNSAIVQMNGVRDRLRVLLVSGEPHAGGRTWRNLLKSDSSVDLVHFTILRPPAKQDGVPVSELSLIAFPTRELFMDKVDDFDLIIFDRYKRRGILALPRQRAAIRGARRRGAGRGGAGLCLGGFAVSLAAEPDPARPALDRAGDRTALFAASHRPGRAASRDLGTAQRMGRGMGPLDAPDRRGCQPGRRRGRDVGHR